MRKLVFTAVLLIILGTTWTLYLEHRNKRFVDSFPKGAATTQQPANTFDAPVVGNKNSEAVRVDSGPAEITAENARVWHEHAGPQANPHASTPDGQNAQAGALVKENPAQTSSDSNPVPREVIEDSKRDLEWYRAMKKWEAKDEALNEERRKLSQELKERTPSGKTAIETHLQRMREDPSYAEEFTAKLETWQNRLEAWEKKKEALKRERPIRPTPTHTH